MKKYAPLLLFLAFLATITVFMTPTSVQGRSPAVEPVTGLSVDEYPEIEPSKAKGIEFTERSSTITNNKRETSSITEGRANRESTLSTSNQGGFPISLIVFVLLLPLVVWYGVMRNLDPSQREQAMEEAIDLAKYRNEKKAATEDKKEEEDSLPKAS